MFQDVLELIQSSKNARLCMLIMCGTSKEFVEFIKESGCG